MSVLFKSVSDGPIVTPLRTIGWWEVIGFSNFNANVLGDFIKRYGGAFTQIYPAELTEVLLTIGKKIYLPEVEMAQLVLRNTKSNTILLPPASRDLFRRSALAEQEFVAIYGNDQAIRDYALRLSTGASLGDWVAEKDRLGLFDGVGKDEYQRPLPDPGELLTDLIGTAAQKPPDMYDENEVISLKRFEFLNET